MNGEAFISRMFAPLDGVPEGVLRDENFGIIQRSGTPADHTCDSAHCLLAPYWAMKTVSPSITPSETEEMALEAPMRARGASSRGGTLLVNWERTAGKVDLSTEGVVWRRG